MTLTPPDSEPEALAAQPLAVSAGSFDRWRRVSGWLLAPPAFLVTWLLTGEALKPEGRTLAAILVTVVVLWITEAIPLWVTAVLGPLSCIVLGVADARTVLTPFVDSVIFLFLGSFVLARAMTVHRLDRRAAMTFLSLRWIGGHPARVLAGMGAVTALVSMWISNTATAAMMFPIALGILQTLHRVRGAAGRLSAQSWPYAAGMMLMIAYAASIGGIGTPVGSPPNLIALGQIRSLANVEISFFRWMALAVPMLVTMGLALFVMVRLLHPAGAVSPRASDDLREYLRQQRTALGGWTVGQRHTLAAFALAVALWVLPAPLSIVLAEGHPVRQLFRPGWWEAGAALAAAGLLFILPIERRPRRFTLTWKEAIKIDWGTLVLFGGGLSLGTLMNVTGVGAALANAILGDKGTDVWALTAAAIAAGIVVSETTSNTAATNIIIPVVIPLAVAAQVNPVPPALGACFGASYGFMLPVSTPPNAIVYASGLVPITKMVRAGILFDLLGFFIILGGLRVLCPALGLGD